MLDGQRPARSRGGRFQRKNGIARRLRRRNLALQRQGEGAKAREQVGDAGCSSDRLADRRDQRGFAIPRGLKEGADRQRDRKTAERDGDGLRLIAGLRPQPFVDAKPGKAVGPR